MVVSGEIAQARGCEMRFDYGEIDVLSRPPSQPLYSRLGLREFDSGYKEDSYSSLSCIPSLGLHVSSADGASVGPSRPELGLAKLLVGRRS